MRWDLLIANLKEPETIALVREKIEHISSGSSPHHASALKVGLKEAFELKKKREHFPVCGCNVPITSAHFIRAISRLRPFGLTSTVNFASIGARVTITSNARDAGPIGKAIMHCAEIAGRALSR